MCLCVYACMYVCESLCVHYFNFGVIIELSQLMGTVSKRMHTWAHKLQWSYNIVSVCVYIIMCMCVCVIYVVCVTVLYVYIYTVIIYNYDVYMYVCI